MAMTAHEVAEKVRKYLKDCHPGGITLTVVEDEVYPVDTWWRVTLSPSAEPPHLFELYEALADVETALLENEGINVLFATLAAEEAQAA